MSSTVSNGTDSSAPPPWYRPRHKADTRKNTAKSLQVAINGSFKFTLDITRERDINTTIKEIEQLLATRGEDSGIIRRTGTITLQCFSWKNAESKHRVYDDPSVDICEKLKQILRDVSASQHEICGVNISPSTDADECADSKGPADHHDQRALISNVLTEDDEYVIKHLCKSLGEWLKPYTHDEWADRLLYSLLDKIILCVVIGSKGECITREKARKIDKIIKGELETHIKPVRRKRTKDESTNSSELPGVVDGSKIWRALQMILWQDEYSKSHFEYSAIRACFKLIFHSRMDLNIREKYKF